MEVPEPVTVGGLNPADMPAGGSCSAKLTTGDPDSAVTLIVNCAVPPRATFAVVGFALRSKSAPEPDPPPVAQVTFTDAPP